MQMLPNYEKQFVMVRDTRGVQLVDVVSLKSHQICLSECPINVSNLRFFHIYFDITTWQYTIATIYKEKNKEKETDEVVWGNP